MHDNQVDRLRAALAARGRHHAALAGRLESAQLAPALVQLARELVGDDGWQFVVGARRALPSPSARRRR